MIEGPGYSGKSTVIKYLASKLEEKNLEVVETREPGGCDGAEAIREMIFRDRKAGKLTALQETHLFYIARAINMTEIVLPANENGKIVLKDRDFMSTFKYQEISGMTRDELINLHREWYIKWGFVEPDLRILLTVSRENILKRIRLRGDDGSDPFDANDEVVLRQAEAYGAEALDISRGKGWFAKNTVVVDANFPIQVVGDMCLRTVERQLGLAEDVEGKRRSVEY